jgi:hypothetical protein
LINPDRDAIFFGWRKVCISLLNDIEC